MVNFDSFLNKLYTKNKFGTHAEHDKFPLTCWGDINKNIVVFVTESIRNYIGEKKTYGPGEPKTTYTVAPSKLVDMYLSPLSRCFKKKPDPYHVLCLFIDIVNEYYDIAYNDVTMDLMVIKLGTNKPFVCLVLELYRKTPEFHEPNEVIEPKLWDKYDNWKIENKDLPKTKKRKTSQPVSDNLLS